MILLSHSLFLLVGIVECGDVGIYNGTGGLLDGHTKVIAFELSLFFFGFLVAEDVV